MASRDQQQTQTQRTERALIRVESQGELVHDPAPQIQDLERNMERARQKMEDNLQLVQQHLRDRADWKAWVAKHPMEAVGIVFGLGFLIGARPRL